MSELPEAVRREIESLPSHYRVRHRTAQDRVVLTAVVRSVPVHLYVDTASYPTYPPELELAVGWTWEHAAGRRIRSLECQERWNRTLGMIALLRELRRRFREDPPRQSPLRVRSAEMRRSLYEFFFGWVARLRERFRARRELAALRRKEIAESSAVSKETEALRARYDELIREQTSRVHRYQKAVDELMSQWTAQSAHLDGLRAESEELEAREREIVEEARQVVGELEGAGKSEAQVKIDPAYRRVRARYEQCTIELGALRDRLSDAESDAERHLAKVRKHEDNLEALTQELENLQRQAAEVITDMTLIELDKEIVEIRAGIQKSGAAEELAALRHKLRKEKARIRVTEEVTEGDAGHDDDIYLEVAGKVSAARELEESLGLDRAVRPVEQERE